MDISFLCYMDMIILVNELSQGYSEEQAQSVCESIFLKKSGTQFSLKMSANMEAKKQQ